MKKLVNTADIFTSPWSRFLYKFIQPIVERTSGFHGINIIYDNVLKQGVNSGEEFCNKILTYFNTKVNIDEKLIEALKSNSPVIVVANHPYGCIDAMALMQTVANHYQNDWRAVANQLLSNIVSFKDKTILVFATPTKEQRKGNLLAIRSIISALKDGKAVIMFPAARVSGRHPEHRFPCDLPWSSHPLKIAPKCDANILFCHIDGQLSDKFLEIPPAKIKKRTIALAQAVNKTYDKTVSLKFSSIMTPEQATKINRFKNKEEVLRAHTYIGADKTPAIPAKQLSEDISDYLTDSKTNFHTLLCKSNDIVIEQPNFVSFCFQGKKEPLAMQEIGMLRSKTFKLIGAGSDKEVDLSEEDDYYHHIVVVEVSSGKIAGAYRLGFTDQIIEEHGEKGLYLNSVFDIDPKFYQESSPAIELSRSFIPPEFQRSPQVLDILWKSLGKVATTNNCKTLYGSVTISAQFSPLSKAILVDTLDRFHSADESLRGHISNSNPFKATTTYHKLLSDAYAEHGLNRLNAVIEEIEENQRPIPPLMRYYSTLDAKFLSFKVEPSFGNAIYCLLTVKLEDIPPRYKKRFLS